jgi:hypothetical protein
MVLPVPPRRLTDSNEMRRLGVELEFAGVELEEASRRVAERVGGTVEPETKYEARVVGAAHGDWIIEIDSELIKAIGRQLDAGDYPDAVEGAAEELIERGALPFVPLEVVSPPIPMDSLDGVDAVIAALRDAGATGTGGRWVYAFGMHLNPEMPDLRAVTIARYLKAFFCLYEWLLQSSAVDLTRRLTPYIDPFPDTYIDRVVHPDYEPSLDGLIDDYLADNATRNRVLDMLPLFTHLDEARVRNRVDDDRVKSRPALHYRLPNCEIDRRDWGLAAPWGDWLQIEHLATDESRLLELCRRYREVAGGSLGWKRAWVEEVQECLIAPGDL